MNNVTPSVMKAAVINQFGAHMTIEEIPVPSIEPEEVLIRVHYADVGAWDPWERDGVFRNLFLERYGVKPTFPYTIGFDGAGTIAAVGGAVKGLSVGDEVYADRHINPKGGFYAQYVSIRASNVARIPEKLSLKEAGALPVDAVTALIGLEDTLRITRGESLLIFGATGGLGHMALQLAKRMGARVFAVCSGPDGVDLAHRLGADSVVDGRRDDILKAAEMFAPHGIDAALYTACGQTANTSSKCLRGGARVAWPRGVAPLVSNRTDLKYSEFFGDEVNNSLLQRLNDMIEAGPFGVHIAKVFSLEEANEAHAFLQKHYLGKLVLEIDDRMS